MSNQLNNISLCETFHEGLHTKSKLVILGILLKWETFLYSKPIVYNWIQKNLK
jgi:hypothetical protein